MLDRLAASIRNATKRFIPEFALPAPRQGIILLYHRVARPQRDPQLLAVSPERFADHLVVLERRARPIALNEMMSRLAAGKPLPPRAVALTFDDGYSDNAVHAEPLLASAGIPATLFVATGYVETGAPYWWDLIETALLDSPLPERLELPFPDGTRSWEITDDPFVSDSWSVLDAAAPGSRHAAYREVTATVKPLGISARNRVLDALRRVAGRDLAAEGDARPMATDEVVAMNRRGVIAIGAHTVDHQQLSMLDVAAQQREIIGSARVLAEWIGHPVDAFAYPYGSTADYNMLSIDCVARAGFRVACSNFPGTVSQKVSRYELPRLLIRNLSSEEFERVIDTAFAQDPALA